MNLVLLTFGRHSENHYQAMFAALSFLKDPLINKVVILTDQADFYRLIQEKAEIIHLDQKQLLEWQGPQQFFWRIKIKALERVQSDYPSDHLLYIDSDTFLAGDLKSIHTQLNAGHVLMYKRESVLADKTDKTLRKMYRTLNGKTLAEVKINGQSEMWNAGVIGLPASQAESLIRRALRLCDEICSTSCPRRLVEQFAFSLALDSTAKLHGCEQSIGHYWGNKTEWNQHITKFFADAMLKRLEYKECICLISRFNWQSVPLEKKRRRTNEKLKRLVDKLFKDKNIRHFP